MVLTSSRCSSGTRSRNLYLSAVRDFEALSARQKKGGHQTEDAVHLLLPLFAALCKCLKDKICLSWSLLNALLADIM